MPSNLLARSPRGRHFLFFAILVPVGLFFLLLLPNPLTDSLLSQACTSAFGRPIELHGVRFQVPTQGGVVFRVREIDFRPMLQAVDSAAGRFIREHDLVEWLDVKDTLWILKPRRGAWYLRLLSAHAGEISIKGGLCLDRGRITRWNGAVRLPKKLSERFPQIVEKRFSQDTFGRRLIKMTWADGRWRLWGRSGPVLEARWQ